MGRTSLSAQASLSAGLFQHHLQPVAGLTVAGRQLLLKAAEMPERLRRADALHRAAPPAVGDGPHVGMHALLAVQGHERAVGQIRMRRRPGVEGLCVGQQLGRPVAEDQRQQRQQGGRHAILGVESSRDIRKFTIRDHRQVHALDPARHIGRAQAQALRRRGVTPQVRVQRRHEAEVRQAGVAAQQVGPVLEMLIEHVQQVEEFRLDGLGRVRVGAQRPQHAAEVAHHAGTGLVARGLVSAEVGGAAELGLQKAALH
jgi:hypothetical protein